MASMNRVILMGNLGADPELRESSTGNPWITFPLATNEPFHDRDKDEWKERTEWHNIVMYGNRAKGLSSILGKGMQVMVEGKIRSRTTEKEGLKRKFTDIQVRDLWLTSGKRAGEGGAQRDAAEAAPN